MLDVRDKTSVEQCFEQVVERFGHIRVNAVCPGVIDTPMTVAPLFKAKQIVSLAKSHPTGRTGKAAKSRR